MTYLASRFWTWLIALTISIASTAARANETSTHNQSGPDVLRSSAAGAPLGIPAVPDEYVAVRKGRLNITYPPRIYSQARAAITHAESDTRAQANQLGISEHPLLEIRLVPDPAAMQQLAPINSPPPSYATGVAYPQIGLALVSATVPGKWEASDMRQVLRHEISHLLLEYATGRSTVPRWFSEGVAIRQSGEHSFERFTTLAVVSFTSGPMQLSQLDSAFDERTGNVEIAYAEAADFVGFVMNNRGASRFPVLLAHLREGIDLDSALRRTYSTSLASLEHDWHQDLRVRFLAAPLWAGTGLFWTLGSALLIAAFARNRTRQRKILARWESEDALTPPPEVPAVGRN